MRVGIDLDGVGYHFTKAFLQDCDVEYFTPTTWNFWEEIDITTEEAHAIMENGALRGDLFFRLDPLPGYMEFIQWLQRRGHTPVIVTARGSGILDIEAETAVREGTVGWFIRHLGDCPEIHFIKNKNEAKCDVYFDDHAEIIEALQADGVHGFVMRGDHNIDYDLENIDDAYDVILALEDGTLWWETDTAEDSHVLEWTQSPETRHINPETGGEKARKQARASLVPPRPLWELSELYGRAAEDKYEDHNWARGYPWSWSYDSLQRHALAFWAGEDTDPQMQVNHMTCVAFHAMALVEFSYYHPEYDDRRKLPR